jgi:HPt (histidine-containing phosphotransfer) domain-containing protein
MLDYELIAEIKRVGELSGRKDLFGRFVRSLEMNLEGFGPAFAECVARGDGRGAALAAHALKGSCRQLGAFALGELFAEIERAAKAGDYAAAEEEYRVSAGLIAQSLAALKQA